MYRLKRSNRLNNSNWGSPSRSKNKNPTQLFVIFNFSVRHYNGTTDRTDKA